MNQSHSVDPTFNSNQSTVLPLTNNLPFHPPAHPDSQNQASTSITSESNTVHRCELMEKGLNEIRTALGALKMTCATLEMHADRLGSEIAALKVVTSTPPLTPMGSQGEFSLNTPVGSTLLKVFKVSNLDILSQPTTPARQIHCLPRSEEADSYLFSHISLHRSVRTALRTESFYFINIFP
jgi:hypothetical protein